VPNTAHQPPAVPKLDLRGAGLTKHSTSPLPSHLFAGTRDKYIYKWLNDSSRDDSYSETWESSTCFTDCPGNWASVGGTIARLSPTLCQSYVTAQHDPPLINTQVRLSCLMEDPSLHACPPLKSLGVRDFEGISGLCLLYACHLPEGACNACSLTISWDAKDPTCPSGYNGYLHANVAQHMESGAYLSPGRIRLGRLAGSKSIRHLWVAQ
jgi:hypothetical protein